MMLSDLDLAEEFLLEYAHQVELPAEVSDELARLALEPLSRRDKVIAQLKTFLKALWEERIFLAQQVAKLDDREYASPVEAGSAQTAVARCEIQIRIFESRLQCLQT